MTKTKRKRILCPECGEIPYYVQTETIKRYTLLDADDKPYKASYDHALKYGIVKRCPCGQKVVITEDGDHSEGIRTEI